MGKTLGAEGFCRNPAFPPRLIISALFLLSVSYSSAKMLSDMPLVKRASHPDRICVIFPHRDISSQLGGTWTIYYLRSCLLLSGMGTWGGVSFLPGGSQSDHSRDLIMSQRSPRSLWRRWVGGGQGEGGSMISQSRTYDHLWAD